MAAGLTAVAERRRDRRVAPADTNWQSAALLRPGQDVVVVNLCAGGALVHSAQRMSPGARTELQLFDTVRHRVTGRIERCRVVAVDPICYEAAVVFDADLPLGRCTGGDE